MLQDGLRDVLANMQFGASDDDVIQIKCCQDLDPLRISHLKTVIQIKAKSEAIGKQNRRKIAKQAPRSICRYLVQQIFAFGPSTSRA